MSHDMCNTILAPDRSNLWTTVEVYGYVRIRNWLVLLLVIDSKYHIKLISRDIWISSDILFESCCASREYDKTIDAVTNKGLTKSLKERHKAEGWVIALVADKEVFEKQLAEEQKLTPEEKRLKIAKVITPDQVVE